MREPAAAAQLAAILMLFIGAVFVLERWSRGNRGFAHSPTRYRPLPRYHLTGARAALVMLACALPVLLGSVVPAMTLTRGVWLTGREWIGEPVLGQIGRAACSARVCENV